MDTEVSSHDSFGSQSPLFYEPIVLNNVLSAKKDPSLTARAFAESSLNRPDALLPADLDFSIVDASEIKEDKEIPTTGKYADIFEKYDRLNVRYVRCSLSQMREGG